MSFLESRHKATQTERRRSARFTIDTPVILRTVTGDRMCRMENISDNGAKLETDNAPNEGVSGWLVLGEEEIYCKVIWTDANSCGIEFDRAIGENRLLAIAGAKAKPGKPIANAGNIQMGRKRGGLLGASRSAQADFFSKRQACSSGSV